MKRKHVRCQSGIIGSMNKLRDNYDDDFESWEYYSNMYRLAERLGYKSAKSAWRNNPVIEYSVIPSDFRKVNLC